MHVGPFPAPTAHPQKVNQEKPFGQQVTSSLGAKSFGYVWWARSASNPQSGSPFSRGAPGLGHQPQDWMRSVDFLLDLLTRRGGLSGKMAASPPGPFKMELGEGGDPGDLHLWCQFFLLWGRVNKWNWGTPHPPPPEGRGDIAVKVRFYRFRIPLHLGPSTPNDLIWLCDPKP